MKKVLPVRYPDIRCFPHHANLLATVCGNDYDFPLFDYYYIQLVYNAEICRLDFSYGLDILNFYKNYPMVNKYIYSRKAVRQNWQSITRFVMDCIDNEGYVLMLADRYYISLYDDSFNQYHLPHDIMLYGYDTEQGIFYAADCFSNGIYSFATLPFEQFENSLLAETENDWLEGIHVWEVKENVYLAIDYDIAKIKQLLKEYIDGIPSAALTVVEELRRNENERNRGDIFYYGLNIYEQLFADNDDVNEDIDLRWIYIICEQKMHLLRLCDRLNIYNSLKNVREHKKKIAELVDKVDIIEALLMKYYLTHNKKIYRKAENLIKALAEEERKELADFERDIFRQEYNADISKIPVRIMENAVKLDKDTKGNWKKTYGSQGFDLVGDIRKLPPCVEEDTYILKNALYVSVLKDGGDKRALQRLADDGRRPVAYLLHDKCFSICMKISGEKSKVTVYCVDYDKLDRRMEVKLIQDGILISEYELIKFEEGVYLSFDVSGEIEIRFINISGPNAVVSGIFWD